MRLINEIWNGFCPLIDLMFRMVYMVLKQVATLIVTIPVIRYLFFWMIRFVALTFVCVIDLLLSVFNVFYLSALEFVDGINDILNANTRRGDFGSDQDDDYNNPEMIGELMLFFASTVFCILCKLVGAIIETLGPLLVTFFMQVLPRLLKYFPILTDVFMWLVDIVTSDSVQRIFDFLLQAIPLVVDVAVSIVCGFWLFLGSGFCLLMYAVVICVGFYLKYYLRPLLCFYGAFFAGCTRDFVAATLAGRSCYGCGGYYTECGCTPKGNHDASGQCDGDQCTSDVNLRDTFQLMQDATSTPSDRPNSDDPIHLDGGFEGGDNPSFTGFTASSRRVLTRATHRLNLHNASFFSSGQVYATPSVVYEALSNGTIVERLVLGTLSTDPVDDHLRHANLDGYAHPLPDTPLWAPAGPSPWFAVMLAETSTLEKIELQWSSASAENYVVSAVNQDVDVQYAHNCGSDVRSVHLVNWNNVDGVRVDLHAWCDEMPNLMRIDLHGVSTPNVRRAPRAQTSLLYATIEQPRNVLMWDPCASSVPVQLTDGHTDIPTVFLKPNGSVPMSFTVALETQHVPSYAILQFAALSQVDARHLQACVAGGCVQPRTFTASSTHAQPLRGAHVMFDFTGISTPDPAEHVLRIHFTEQALRSLHSSEWSATLLDLGMSPDFDAKYAWVHATRLQDSKLGHSAAARCKVLPRGNHRHVAQHRDPFAQMPREWFGVTEVQVFANTQMPTFRAAVDPHVHHLDLLEFEAMLHSSSVSASRRMQNTLDKAVRLVQMRHHQSAGARAIYDGVVEDLKADGIASTLDHLRHDDIAALHKQTAVTCFNSTSNELHCHQTRVRTLASHRSPSSAQLAPTSYGLEPTIADTLETIASDSLQQIEQLHALQQTSDGVDLRHTDVEQSRRVLDDIVDPDNIDPVKLIEDALGCEDGLSDCITGMIDKAFDFARELLTKLLEVVNDMFGQFILFCFDLLDKAMRVILRVTGIEAQVQLLACEACSLTTAVTGILTTLIDNFEMTLCMDFYDLGKQTCEELGVDSPLHAGASVFTNMWALTKLAFGMLQVLPAFVEVIISSFPLLSVMGLFEDLWSDAQFVAMFIHELGSQSGALTTIFEAVQEAINTGADAVETIQQSAVRKANSDIKTTPENTAVARGAFDSLTSSSVSVPFDPPDAQLVEYVDDGTVIMQCLDGSTTVCQRQPVNASNITGHIDLQEQKAALQTRMAHEKQSANSNLRDSDSFSYALNCGCQTAAPACAHGPGKGNCPTAYSKAAERRHKALERQQSENADAGGRESWPACASVPRSSIIPDVAWDGQSNFVKVFVDSQRCYLKQPRMGASSTTSELAALQMEEQITGQDAGSLSFPWIRFSKQDGTFTKSTDSDLRLDEFAYTTTPKLREYHRRRTPTQDITNDVDTLLAQAGPDRQLLFAAHVMGVQDVYDNQSATTYKQFRQAIRNQNLTYEQLQVHLLQRDFVKVQEAWNWTHGWAPPADVNFTHVYRMAAALGSARRFDDIADSAEQLACVLDMDKPPNTYPCCKGLWCCIRPPFPRDFRFKKQWFVWRDSWVRDTKCHEFDSYLKGWKFVPRALAKLIRGDVEKQEPIWPFGQASEWLWDFLTFPENKWPQELIHGDEHWPYTSVCVVLNCAIWMTAVVAFVILYVQSKVLLYFLMAHVVIVSECLVTKPDLKSTLESNAQQILAKRRQADGTTGKFSKKQIKSSRFKTTDTETRNPTIDGLRV